LSKSVQSVQEKCELTKPSHVAISPADSLSKNGNRDHRDRGPHFFWESSF
jgi:hypothetical protein